MPCTRGIGLLFRSFNASVLLDLSLSRWVGSSIDHCVGFVANSLYTRRIGIRSWDISGIHMTFTIRLVQRRGIQIYFPSFTNRQTLYFNSSSIDIDRIEGKERKRVIRISATAVWRRVNVFSALGKENRQVVFGKPRPVSCAVQNCCEISFH